MNNNQIALLCIGAVLIGAAGYYVGRKSVLDKMSGGFHNAADSVGCLSFCQKHCRGTCTQTKNGNRYTCTCSKQGIQSNM